MISWLWHQKKKVDKLYFIKNQNFHVLKDNCQQSEKASHGMGKIFAHYIW